jgi:hypothetical protein
LLLPLVCLFADILETDCPHIPALRGATVERPGVSEL